MIDEQGEASDLEDRVDHTLPGATRGDLSVRRTRPEVRVPAVAFSPTGRAFCVASTEGLLVYSLDNALQFDPFDLDINITPASTLQAIKEKDFLLALIMAFRLNERLLIRQVYEAIPVSDVTLLVKELPIAYLARLLRFVAQATDESPHLEFNLRWIEALLHAHGPYLKEHATSLASELRTVQKVIAKIQLELARLADDNVYALDYLLAQPLLSAGVDDEPKEMPLMVNGNGALNSQMDEDMGGEWMGLDDEGGDNRM